MQFVSLFSLIHFPKKVKKLVFIKCSTFEFQKNDPPFQLKLPPKAARPEKEVDPEYEEKMVSAFMTRHPAAFYGPMEQGQLQGVIAAWMCQKGKTDTDSFR